VAGQASETRTQPFRRGSDDGTHARGQVRNKGSLPGCEPAGALAATTVPRGMESARVDGGWVRSTAEAG
jgi:hypothetical protein